MQFLREVRENSLAAYENQEYAFDDLVKRLVTKRDNSRNPLFDVLFEMQKSETSSRGESGDLEGGLKIKTYGREIKTTKIDLDWVGRESEDRIDFTITYCTKLYREETVKFMAACYLVLIDSIINNEKSKIKDLNYSTFEKKIEKNKNIDFNF